MTYAQLLLLIIFTPIAGACVISISASFSETYAKWIALATMLFTFCLTVILVVDFPAEGVEQARYVTDVPWMSAGGVSIHFNVGLDGLGLWLFALSSLLNVTSVLVSWKHIKTQQPLFYALLLVLTTGCLGVFTARDIILFYVFFEFTLIPLFFLIGIWGAEDRRYAASKFFIYTLAGSMLTFVGLLSIVALNYHYGGAGEFTFSIPELTASLAKTPSPIPLHYQIVLFLALFAGFAIKVPLFPLHTWLPLAHVQAPVAGSVDLAGLLLKIGTYGFIRFNLPLLPDASAVLMPYILWLSVAGIVYGALLALAQSDMKKLIAYSSVSHMGFCMLGIFAFNRLGMQGGTLQMINHGISTGGLFAMIGMLYERYHTREIKEFGGIAKKLPILAFFMVVFTFSSIGVPGLNGFAGEFLVLLGMFHRAFGGSLSGDLAWQTQVIAVVAVSGVVLGAWYMLWLVQRVFFGPLKEPSAHQGHGHHEDEEPGAAPEPVRDLSWHEIAAVAPLVVFVVWIGLAPSFFLERMAPTLDQISSVADSSLRLREHELQTHEIAAQAGQEEGVQARDAQAQGDAQQDINRPASLSAVSNLEAAPSVR